MLLYMYITQRSETSVTRPHRAVAAHRNMAVVRRSPYTHFQFDLNHPPSSLQIACKSLLPPVSALRFTVDQVVQGIPNSNMAILSPGELEELRQRLAAGGDVEDRESWDGGRLHRAAEAGDLLLVKLLIEFKADVNARAWQGYCKNAELYIGLVSKFKPKSGPLPLPIAIYGNIP